MDSGDSSKSNAVSSAGVCSPYICALQSYCKTCVHLSPSQPYGQLCSPSPLHSPCESLSPANFVGVKIYMLLQDESIWGHVLLKRFVRRANVFCWEFLSMVVWYAISWTAVPTCCHHVAVLMLTSVHLPLARTWHTVLATRQCGDIWGVVAGKFMHLSRWGQVQGQVEVLIVFCFPFLAAENFEKKKEECPKQGLLFDSPEVRVLWSG